ncbi:MAG: transposase, partial [Gammaproteobacteria bacterium]|nr:transposase [Gammaproteobacteria bacterium]
MEIKNETLPESWIAEEIKYADLGDNRLNRRFGNVL